MCLIESLQLAAIASGEQLQSTHNDVNPFAPLGGNHFIKAKAQGDQARGRLLIGCRGSQLFNEKHHVDPKHMNPVSPDIGKRHTK